MSSPLWYPGRPRKTDPDCQCFNLPFRCPKTCFLSSSLMTPLVFCQGLYLSRTVRRLPRIVNGLPLWNMRSSIIGALIRLNPFSGFRSFHFDDIWKKVMVDSDWYTGKIFVDSPSFYYSEISVKSSLYFTNFTSQSFSP